MILNVSYGNKDALVRHSGASVKLETDTKYVFFIQVQRILEGTKIFTTTTPQ